MDKCQEPGRHDTRYNLWRCNAEKTQTNEKGGRKGRGGRGEAIRPREEWGGQLSLIVGEGWMCKQGSSACQRALGQATARIEGKHGWKSKIISNYPNHHNDPTQHLWPTTKSSSLNNMCGAPLSMHAEPQGRHLFAKTRPTHSRSQASHGLCPVSQPAIRAHVANRAETDVSAINQWSVEVQRPRQVQDGFALG